MHDVPGHYLKRNHSTELPTRILVLDTETTPTIEADGIAQRFRLGWTALCRVSSWGRIVEEEWRYWTHPVPLLEYIEKSCPRDGTLWMFANNIFFDLQALGFFRDFTREGWELDFSYDSQVTYMLIIKRGRYTLKALSVSNYWAASTREIGEMLGEPKLEVDFETSSEADLSIYCFRDTEIALDAMAAYFELVRIRDLGSFRLSRAAQSYAAFRHRFMGERIYCHEDQEIRDLECLAYEGGRTEAYRIGEVQGGPFICLDVNSMYPHIMRNYRLPVKCVDYRTDLSLDEAAAFLVDYSMIAEVEIETDEPIYSWKHEGKAIFPVGRFTTYLCTEGIRQALMRGHAKRIVRAAFYRDAIVFREYIDYFWKMRQEAKERGDRIMDRMAKLLMNSLYGKLAQRRPIVVSDTMIEEDDYYRMEIYDLPERVNTVTTRMFHREIITEGEELVDSAVVAIPAHITEYGRMLLYSIQENVGRENVLYCDTDSVFIPTSALHLLSYPIQEGRLGALSRKWTSERLVINGAKDYETDHTVVMKGIPETAEMIGPRMWQYTFWPGQRSHLAKRIDDRYVQREITKVLDRPYDKGRVNDDGTVSPWILPDLLSSSDLDLLLA